MAEVKNLESKISTNGHEPAIAPYAENESSKSSFISGDVGVTAKVSFRFSSPWKAIGAWIRKVAA